MDIGHIQQWFSRAYESELFQNTQVGTQIFEK